MKGGLRARMLASSALLALLVGAVFSVLLISIGELRGDSDRARHSEEVLAAANNLEKLVLDLETGVRGFVITGDERFLAPWRSARTEGPAQAAELERLVADNGAQEERARSIGDSIRSYLNQYSVPLVAATRRDRESGRVIVATGEGKRRVDAIRGQFDGFAAAESALSDSRRAEAGDSARRAVGIAIGGLVGSILFVLAFAGYLSRAIVLPVRRVAEAAWHLARGDLAARVPEGGAGEVGELGSAFNAMAGSLQESQDELESQNAELELQTSELEDQQAQLTAANVDLAHERALLAAFMETTPDHVYFKDAESRFIRVSASLVRWLGAREEDVIGKTDSDFFGPEHAGKALADEQELMRTGVPLIGVEEKETWPDGRETWVSTTKLPLRDGAGGIVGTFGLSRDVTERRRIEDEIRTLNEELERRAAVLENQNTELEAQQAHVESANEELEAQQAELERALAALEDEKRLIEAFYEFGNRVAAELEVAPLARTVLAELADVAGAEIGALWTLDGEGDPGDAFALLATRGVKVDRLPATLRPDDGLAGRALTERRPVEASHGEAGLRLAAFGEEVAVRHELHVPLLQGERLLGAVTLGRLGDRAFAALEVEALEHLADQAAVALSNAISFGRARRLGGINSAVLDSASDAITMVDTEGRIVLANAATHRIAELHGVSPEGSLAELTAQIRERTTDPDAYRATHEAIAADPESEGESEYELADSGRVFRRYTAPVRDPGGEIIGRLFTHREVTSEREAERLKSELVATVSHELRTPLASILGFAELVVQRDLDEPTRRRYLETIYDEGKRLTHLINDFLDLQRIEEGGFRLELAPFELRELLRAEVELYSGQSSRHELELELPDAPLVVLAERERIAQVLGNLLSNAIKYSPAGGSVKVAAEADGGVVRVSVTDSGLGMPADQQQRVFTKFFRVDSSDTREIGGTGLGLALCRQIVEAHGGHIGFQSVEGRGSTFWFELPAGARTNGGAPRERVLVVGEDDRIAAILRELLEADGYAVDVATDGVGALSRALADPPALVCLDVGLGGEVDGWKILGRLKAEASTAAVPVVVCSGSNGRDQAAALGASDFLAKPFSAQQLRDTVGRLLPHGGSVLVVDDEESVRNLVRETLGGNGLELREAADGEEALAAIARRRPDAIVLDLMMPRLDGFTVLERLQENAETRGIPVVVLTAKRLSVAEQDALRARAVSLLEKSAYSAAELRRLIQRALGKQPLDGLQ